MFYESSDSSTSNFIKVSSPTARVLHIPKGSHVPHVHYPTGTPDAPLQDTEFASFNGIGQWQGQTIDNHVQGTISTLAMAVASFVACFTVARWWTKPKPSLTMLSSAAESAEDSWRGGQSWSGLTKGVKTINNTEDIMKILPHRYPFLLVDKVIEFEPGKRAVGVKNVTMNEPQFTGHFPDRPIMPGVLMIEAMAQLGGIVCLQPPVSDGTGVFFFAGINGVRWRRPVVPGDTLVMEMELVTFKEKFGIAKMKGKAYVDGALAVDVEEFTFALAK
eukprot:EG_transcript_23694